MCIKPTSLFRPLLLLQPKKLRLITINFILSGKQIRILRPDPTITIHELISKDHDEIQWDSEIPGDEVLIVPFTVGFRWSEYIEVLEDSDDDAEEEGAIGSFDAEWCSVG